ncbi:hypothetical protein [Bradyrhizobium sp. RDI18]
MSAKERQLPQWQVAAEALPLVVEFGGHGGGEGWRASALSARASSDRLA